MPNFENQAGKKLEFSFNEIEKLRLIADTDAIELASILEKEIRSISEYLERTVANPHSLAGCCEIASHELDRILKTTHFDSTVLEGEIEIAEKEWLTHRINLIRLKQVWVIIDLTARQMPWFRNRSWYLETVDPDMKDLEFVLREQFHWWIPTTRPNHEC